MTSDLRNNHRQQKEAELRRATKTMNVDTLLGHQNVVVGKLTDTPVGYSVYFLPPDKLPDAEAARMAVQVLRDQGYDLEPASGFKRLHAHGTPPYYGLVLSDNDPEVVKAIEKQTPKSLGEGEILHNDDALKRLNREFSALGTTASHGRQN